MKIVSWNIKGLGDYSKPLAVKHLNMKINPELVLIQETKKRHLKSKQSRNFGVQKTSVGHLWKPMADQDGY